ncbi:PIG-L deacetylase family protein [Azovibrio restrictus]|uniref:PIG-L deacetylase family protein n=1 Tax=Azovibrio restrictus TaxID=146938 RepID=UPI0026EF71C8|nr:PIG-L deacetylase family protein [Azovibrio restrictus]MDD3483260.1 PIG-L family deacetylase [Azovibrio restrictus]
MSFLEALTLDPRGAGITVFAPHPDDEVFGCGGLLSLLAAQGFALRVIIVSDGGFGEFGRDVAARKQESRSAMSLLGEASLDFWDLPDQGLGGVADLDLRFRDELETHPCQLMLAPSPWEVHPDHLAVCMAASKAWRQMERPPQLAFYEVGVPMPRAFILNISQVAERKRQAMACFASQNAIQDYALQIGGLNTYRGYVLEARGAWGEAYFQPEPALLRAGGVEVLAGLLAGQHLLWSPGEGREESRQPFTQETLAALLEENQRLQATQAALYASTSWRLTAPLRALVSWFRSLSSGSGR